MRSALIKLDWILSSQSGFLSSHARGVAQSAPAVCARLASFSAGCAAVRSRLSVLARYWYVRRTQPTTSTFGRTCWLPDAHPSAANAPCRRRFARRRVCRARRELSRSRDARRAADLEGSAGDRIRQADLMKPVSAAADGGSILRFSVVPPRHRAFRTRPYGDPVDPLGYERGIANMARLVAAGGRFYSPLTPIGKERVEFNANRVFDPRTIIRCARANRLQLQELTVITTNGELSQADLSEESLQRLALAHYNLGVFTFRKSNR